MKWRLRLSRMELRGCVVSNIWPGGPVFASRQVLSLPTLLALSTCAAGVLAFNLLPPDTLSVPHRSQREIWSCRWTGERSILKTSQGSSLVMIRTEVCARYVSPSHRTGPKSTSSYGELVQMWWRHVYFLPSLTSYLFAIFEI